MVTFDAVPASQVYPLVEKLGPGITTLDFSELTGTEDSVRKTAEKINMYQVLAACPNIESLIFWINSGLEKGPKFSVKPANFKNMKECV